MTESIQHLTPDQEALIPVYRRKWHRIALLATDNVNRTEVEWIVRAAYRDAGQRPPLRFYWVASPVQRLVADGVFRCDSVIAAMNAVGRAFLTGERHDPAQRVSYPLDFASVQTAQLSQAVVEVCAGGGLLADAEFAELVALHGVSMAARQAFGALWDQRVADCVNFSRAHMLGEGAGYSRAERDMLDAALLASYDFWYSGVGFEGFARFAPYIELRQRVESVIPYERSAIITRLPGDAVVRDGVLYQCYADGYVHTTALDEQTLADIMGEEEERS